MSGSAENMVWKYELECAESLGHVLKMCERPLTQSSVDRVDAIRARNGCGVIEVHLGGVDVSRWPGR